MEPLGDALHSELRKLGPQAGIADAVAAWPDAVGAEIARNAWPARFQRDGTLIVHARDAVWAFELTQRAAEISSRMPSKPSLKFIPGPVPEPSAEAPANAQMSPPEATPEQVLEASRYAASIDDDELRELVARAARASLARTPDDRSV
jgi:hypothetical protein